MSIDTGERGSQPIFLALSDAIIAVTRCGMSVRALLSYLVGSDTRSRLGTLLSLCGVGLLLYAVGTYFELTPGSTTVLPDPPALLRPRPTVAATVAPALAPPTATPAPTTDPVLPAAVSPPSPRPTAVPAPTARPTATPMPLPAPYTLLPQPAEAADRRDAAGIPHPGTPIWLRIEKIGLETKVIEAGITRDAEGNAIWQTLPYVAAHYTVTGPVGARGNPVIAGHVVTLYEGNVFRNLYKVDFGDRIEVKTDDATFVYEVADIQLVDPSHVEVMAPTADARLTLITCGGRFDTRTRTFDKRLVVVGKLVPS